MAQRIAEIIGYLGLAAVVVLIAWGIACPKPSNPNRPPK